MKDWKERLKEEYAQTKERYERLKAENIRQEIHYRTKTRYVELAEDSARRDLMREQQEAMENYLYLLELRAELDNIEL